MPISEITSDRHKNSKQWQGNMGILKDKVAIVTGASSGIGKASARLFAQQGAAVIAAARREKELDILVEEILSDRGEAVALAGDVRDEYYSIALVDLAERRFGGLDIALNNAGILGTLAPAIEIS
jgi:NAD(P)-dependent dehydrogenase (short-subunit alcohol dehydrogenase family)